MFKSIFSILRVITETKWHYLWFRSKFRVSKNGVCHIGKNVKIRHCNIYLSDKARLIIHDAVSLTGVHIYIENGEFEIGKNSILEKGGNTDFPLFLINEGKFVTGNHTKLSCKKIWIRFGGLLKIGDYTNINSGSELRVDEKVHIGSYNQISYNVNIWDTNTHNIYAVADRRKIAENHFPYFGYEYEKPKTKPIVIGNDCWIGQNASILKGVSLGNNVVIGYNTILANVYVADNKKIVMANNYKMIDN